MRSAPALTPTLRRMATTEFEQVPAVSPSPAPAPAAGGLVVMKFGGTSVDGPERLKAVARRLAAAHQAGNRVVGVLSAMGDTTNDLMRLARDVSARPDPRELDMLISVGERVSCALAARPVPRPESAQST